MLADEEYRMIHNEIWKRRGDVSPDEVIDYVEKHKEKFDVDDIDELVWRFADECLWKHVFRIARFFDFKLIVLTLLPDSLEDFMEYLSLTDFYNFHESLLVFLTHEHAHIAVLNMIKLFLSNEQTIAKTEKEIRSYLLKRALSIHPNLEDEGASHELLRELCDHDEMITCTIESFVECKFEDVTAENFTNPFCEVEHSRDVIEKFVDRVKLLGTQHVLNFQYWLEKLETKNSAPPTLDDSSNV